MHETSKPVSGSTGMPVHIYLTFWDLYVQRERERESERERERFYTYTAIRKILVKSLLRPISDCVIV